MPRSLCTAVVLTLAVATVSWAQAPSQKSDLAANAALQYWLAFSQLPPTDKEHEKIHAELFTIPPHNPAAQKLITASHQSLLFLRRGAALPQCDWGLEYDDGISLLLPQRATPRDLARLAVLRGRQSLEAGNLREGQGDALAIMTLARHVGRDPLMICLLVRVAVEGMAIDLFAPHLPELKISHSQLTAAFDALPPAATLEQIIGTEKEFMVGWTMRRLKEEEARRPGAWRELWRGIMSGEKDQLPEAVKKVDSINDALEMLEQLIPVCDELIRLVKLPNEQFDSVYPEFKAKTKATYPLAGVILPAVDQVRAKEQRHAARLGMLLAAAAIVEGGPEKLQQLKSPFGPYEYRALDKDFELKSKLQYEGQPVTLTIGQRK